MFATKTNSWVILAAGVMMLGACGGMEDIDQTGLEGDEWSEDGGKADEARPAKTFIVTEAKNGKTLTARVGDTVDVRLGGNPTTGYSWECVSGCSRSFPVVESYLEDEPQLIGSGGTFSFVFKPDYFAAGKSHALTFAYYRPFEGVNKAIKTFKLTIKVPKVSQPKIVKITASMNGQTITVKRGQSAWIELAGNPTTGYEWRVVAQSKSLALAQSYYTPSQPQTIGGGGTYTFVFTPDAMSVGSNQIKLAYLRSFEPEQIDQTFEITIVVP